MSDFPPHPSRRGAVVTGASSGIGAQRRGTPGDARRATHRPSGARRNHHPRRGGEANAAELDSADFAAQVEVNLIGAQGVCHVALPAKIERRRGDVVLLSSQNAKAARPLLGAYNASKAGLEQLGRTLPVESIAGAVLVAVSVPRGPISR